MTKTGGRDRRLDGSPWAFVGRQGKTMAKLADVAKLANVSASTASIILRGKGPERRIPMQTCERVKQAASQLGYIPNLSARQLRDSKRSVTPVIGLLWDCSMSVEILNQVIQNLKSYQNQSGRTFEMIVHPYDRGKLCSELSLLTVDTFNIAIVTDASQDEVLFLEQQKTEVPVILLNQVSEQFHYVKMDNRALSEAAFNDIRRAGHRHVGMVVLKQPFYGMQERQSYFSEMCAAAGIRLDVYPVADHVLSALRLGAEVEIGPDGATAYFCMPDFLTAAFGWSLHNRLEPAAQSIDIVGIGAETLQLPPWTHIRHTSIRLPLRELLQECVNIVDAILFQQSRAHHGVSIGCASTEF